MDKIIAELYGKYDKNKPQLCRTSIETFAETVLGLIFSQHAQSHIETQQDFAEYFNKNKDVLKKILNCLEKDFHQEFDREQIITDFYTKLSTVADKLKLDAEFFQQQDPAAFNTDLVILSYPGFYAVCIYRVAHALSDLKVQYLPRVLSEYAHSKTGIDIHPHAKIGVPFFVDHGTGVVIGETCEIGDRVKIYQGVTLGALSVSKKKQGKKRHPTIEDDVLIYANATILGGRTLVGKNSTIGGNVWLTESVEENSTIVNEVTSV